MEPVVSKNRSRVTTVNGSYKSGSGYYPNPSFVDHSFPIYLDSEEDITTSHKSVKGKYINGGDWTKSSSSRRYISPSTEEVWILGSNPPYLNEYFSGKVYGTQPSALTRPALYNPALLDSWGVKAIARTSPTTPRAQLGQALAELREIPLIPFLHIKDVLYNFRHLGGEYLNIQFGWVPFLSDLKDLMNVIHNWDSLVRNLEEGQNKLIHRKTVLVDSSSTSTSSGSAYPWPVLLTQMYSGRGNWTQVITETEKIWFSGHFKYQLPPISKGPLGYVQHERAILRILTGLDLTPKLVWDLLPWSWLVDWFSNVGANIQNISSALTDSLIIQDAYVMRHYEKKNQIRWVQKFVYSGRTLTCGSDRIDSQKTRRSITSPYGFGVTFDSLSSKQLSILAALGISRGSFLSR